jgi:hypothetical protein
MRKQQRFSLHCLPGCGTIAVLRQGSTTMKTTAMTAEERVRYMTQAPVRRLILEMSAPTVISMLVTSFYNMADGVASVGGGRRAAGIIFDPGRLYPAKSFRAIPHNSKCRYGERGAADAKPKAQIILDGNADAVPQLPERCLSRKAGIVRCCLRACRRRVRPARRGSAGLCAGAAYGAVRAEDVSQ